MGFNKRYIDIEKIKNYLSYNKPLYSLFDVDSIIFCDNKSHMVFSWIKHGYTQEEIKHKIKGLDG